MVTMKKIEAQHLPDMDEAFIKSLGINDGTVEGLRADVRKNLEREVKFRVLARNKAAAMDALVKVAELDLPKALVDNELERLVASARDDLKQRGIKDADKAPIPTELFQPQAERRVRLGLVVAELVKTNNLQAQPDQLRPGSRMWLATRIGAAVSLRPGAAGTPTGLTDVRPSSGHQRARPCR